MMSHAILAMSDTAQNALVVILGTFIAAITPTVLLLLNTIIKRLAAVEKNTNGIMSEKNDKIELAEARVRGITTPEGPVAHETIIRNDPNSPSPPTITSTIESTTTEKQL